MSDLSASNAPQAPLRKGMAVTSLVLGILGLPTLGLLFIGGLVGLVLGIMALLKANRSPNEYGGKGFAIAGIITNILAIIVMPVVIGIMAAIAIPSLLRARVSANEASAIGDVRTMISAEVAYSTANGNFFDTPECVGTPSLCIPGYTGPSFLDPTLATLATKSGYQRRFVPGPPAGRGAVSPSSLQSFAYVAVPLSRGQTGVRGFCGDSSGMVCATQDGSEPAVENGQCAASCAPLR